MAESLTSLLKIKFFSDYDDKNNQKKPIFKLKMVMKF